MKSQAVTLYQMLLVDLQPLGVRLKMVIDEILTFKLHKYFLVYVLKDWGIKKHCFVLLGECEGTQGLDF